MGASYRVIVIWADVTAIWCGSEGLLLAGKGLMGFSLQTCHPVNATVAIGQRGGIRAVGQKQPVAYVRWADCFRLTTDIGTLIKTVAGR